VSDYPAYYARHQVPYVAWFCNADEAARFLAYHQEMGDLWVDGDEPYEGVEYRNLGHLFCLAADCPEGETAE
jgi:hypothetical protein